MNSIEYWYNTKYLEQKIAWTNFAPCKLQVQLTAACHHSPFQIVCIVNRKPRNHRIVNYEHRRLNLKPNKKTIIFNVSFLTFISLQKCFIMSSNIIFEGLLFVLYSHPFIPYTNKGNATKSISCIRSLCSNNSLFTSW